MDYTILWLPPRLGYLLLYYILTWTVIISIPVVTLLPKYYGVIRGSYRILVSRLIFTHVFQDKNPTHRKPV